MEQQNKTKEFVASIEGFYDEVAEARTMNINARRHCWGAGNHDFINASLFWEGEKGPDGTPNIALQSYKGPDTRSTQWGSGYGGVRFCRKCKHIDCIHNFDEGREICVGNSTHYIGYVVATCQFCKRRILKACVEVIAEDLRPVMPGQEMCTKS